VNVVTLPASLDERYFDPVVKGLDDVEPGERVLFDASHVRWVDPYGLIGLLAVGTVAAQRGERPLLKLPDSPEVNSYMSRMAFFDHADDIFELHGHVKRGRHDGDSEVLLEITAVNEFADIHKVVDLINQRGLRILTTQLHYPLREAYQFSVIFSEVCQNIVEHAEAGGWVATQTYNWSKKLGRKVVIIAVMDLGVGFRQSLAATHAARFPDGWTDLSALETAFHQGKSRHHDPGRGQGLKQIRKQVDRWEGRMTIRSGNARIADVPSWDDTRLTETCLAVLPGSQIGIVLPARVPVLNASPVASSAARR
jgi:hypothetical protein